MPRSTLVRHRNRAIFSREQNDGGGGGDGQQQQGQQQQGQQQQGQQQQGQQQAQGPAKTMAKDEQGNDLGYPLNTAVAEMEPTEVAAYWRTEAKKQQRAREDAERRLRGGSGTVSDQQQKQDAQTSGPSVSEQVEQARREGQRDAVVVSMTASLQMRGKTPEEITELLDVVDPGKFLGSDGKVDTTKVANYISRVAPASTGGGTGGQPGQGQRNHESVSRLEAGRHEAQRRGYSNQNNPQRGVYGGLRRG